MTMNIQISFNIPDNKLTDFAQLIQQLQADGHTITQKQNPAIQNQPQTIQPQVQRQEVQSINVQPQTQVLPKPEPKEPKLPATVEVFDEQAQTDFNLRPKTLDDIRNIMLQIAPEKRLQLGGEILGRLGLERLSEIPQDKLTYVYNYFHKFFEVGTV